MSSTPSSKWASHSVFFLSFLFFHTWLHQLTLQKWIFCSRRWLESWKSGHWTISKPVKDNTTQPESMFLFLYVRCDSMISGEWTHGSLAVETTWVQLEIICAHSLLKSLVGSQVLGAGWVPAFISWLFKNWAVTVSDSCLSTGRSIILLSELVKIKKENKQKNSLSGVSHTVNSAGQTKEAQLPGWKSAHIMLKNMFNAINFEVAYYIQLM